MDDDRFVVMGGIGFDAAMLRDADPELKEHLGAVAYVLSGFKNLRRRATRFRLRLDDRPPSSGAGQGVLIGNLGRLQGGLPVMPDARPDDGLLDVGVLQTRTVLDWLALAARVADPPPPQGPAAGAVPGPPDRDPLRHPAARRA